MGDTDWMWCFERPKEAATEIDRLRVDNAAMKARIAELEAALVLVREVNASLDARAEQAEAQLAREKVEGDKILAALEAAQTELAFMRGHGIVQDNETLRTRVGELEAKIETWREAHYQVHQHAEKAERRIAELELRTNVGNALIRAEKAEARIAEANERAKNFEDAIEGWIADYAEMKLRAEEAETDRATAYARGDGLLARAEKAEADCKRAAEALEATKNLYDHAMGMIEDRCQHVTRLSEDCEHAKAERDALLNKQPIQQAILAALGCTKIDYRSPRKLDKAASQIADFVIAAARDQSQDGEGQDGSSNDGAR